MPLRVADRFAQIDDIVPPKTQGVRVQSLTTDLSMFVVSKPGDNLSFSRHRDVYRMLVPLTSLCFGADMTGYWHQRRQEGYLARITEFALVVDQARNVVGWSGFHALQFDAHNIIYLDSTGIAPDRRRNRVMGVLANLLVDAARTTYFTNLNPTYIAARSESPIVYQGLSRMVDDEGMFPKPNTPPPDGIMAVAADVAYWLGQEALLERTSLILKGAYTNTLDELYGELPTTGNAAFDGLFRDVLGPLDAYILVGKLADL